MISIERDGVRREESTYPKEQPGDGVSDYTVDFRVMKLFVLS